MILGSNLSVTATPGSVLTISGPISETGGSMSLSFAGGLLVLSGSNTYSGGTTVSGGTLQAKTASSLPGSGISGLVFVAPGAVLAANVGGAGEWTAANLDVLRVNAAFSSGAALGIDTTDGAFTYGSNIAGNVGLAKLGVNTLALTGSNTYGGATAVNGGVLAAGAANALSPSSAITVSGGTLDASGFANKVASLNIAGGGLNLGLGNTLTSNGTAALNGGLNVSGTGTLGNYRLLAYTSRTGAFTGVTGLNPNYGLLYNANGTELDALHKAQLGLLSLTAVNATVIAGGVTNLTLSLANSAPASSDVLNFTASTGGFGYGLSTTGSLAASSSGSFTIANGFNSYSLAAGIYMGTVTLTGTNSALGGRR